MSNTFLVFSLCEPQDSCQRTGATFDVSSKDFVLHSNAIAGLRQTDAYGVIVFVKTDFEELKLLHEPLASSTAALIQVHTNPVLEPCFVYKICPWR